MINASIGLVIGLILGAVSGFVVGFSISADDTETGKGIPEDRKND